MGAYRAALTGLAHRRLRPAYLAHLVTEHADAAVIELRRRVKG